MVSLLLCGCVCVQADTQGSSAQTDWECDIELQEAEAGHAGEVWLARQKWV